MEFPFQLTKVLLNKMELILSNQYDSTCYQYDDPKVTGWVICLIAIHGKNIKILENYFLKWGFVPKQFSESSSIQTI